MDEIIVTVKDLKNHGAVDDLHILQPSGERVEDSVESEVSAETATSMTDWAEKMGLKPTVQMAQDLRYIFHRTC